MFTYVNDNFLESAVLHFKNEVLDISCRPEDFTYLCRDGYGFDSNPDNGTFRFYYDDEKISFSVAKYGDGQGGSFDITFRMTKEIKESLEDALELWISDIERKREE